MPIGSRGNLRGSDGLQDPESACTQADGAVLLEDVDRAEEDPNRDEDVAHYSDSRDPAETPCEDADADCHDSDADAESAGPASRSRVCVAAAFGLIAVLGVSALVGWLGYGSYQLYRSEQRRDFFLAAGRQAALNLTTVNYTEVDAEVQRILASSTGAFYEDFHRRAPAFVDVVKQAQSKSAGTVMAAGLESEKGDRAQVLVTMSVASSTAAASDQPTRTWRMRVHLRKVGGEAKVSNVEFVE